MTLQWLNLYTFIFLFNTLYAKQIIWDGNLDGDGDNTSWHDPLNWNTDLMPTYGDSVIVEVTGSQVTIISGFIAEAGALYVNQGADLHIEENAIVFVNGDLIGITNSILTVGEGSTLRNDGFLFIENAPLNACYIYGLVRNYGEIEIRKASQNGVLATGSLYNYGIFTIDSTDAGYQNLVDGYVFVEDTATFSIINTDQVALDNDGDLENNGQFHIDSCTNGIFHNGTLSNHGQLTVTNVQDVPFTTQSSATLDVVLGSTLEIQPGSNHP